MQYPFVANKLNENEGKGLESGSHKSSTRRTLRGQIKKIMITKLFGSKDYNIYLNSDIPTVLTGPNGSGKSTILRLVNALSRGNLFEISASNFERLIIEFQDGKIFEFDKSQLVSRVSWDDQVFEIQSIDAEINIPSLARKVLRENNYELNSALEQLDQIPRSNYSSFQEIRDARTALRSLQHHSEDLIAPPWFDSFTKYFRVTLIDVKRLESMIKPQDAAPNMRLGSTDGRVAINEASDFIGRLIMMESSRFGRMSQKFDQELPLRVMHAIRSNATPELEEILALSTEIDVTTADLRRAGLLQATGHDVPRLLEELGEDSNAYSLRVVAEILESTKQRLESLKSTEVKLNALKQFLDRRLLDKELSLNSRGGMSFVTAGGSDISVNDLSSGEQHLVMLAFTLLFICTKDSTVLIDEPELSLHIAWQDELLSDFTTLGRQNNLSFVMASHSPTIIASMPDCEWPVEGF